MAVAVPIVSKKSVSMKLKIVRSAARRPSCEKTFVRSNAPIVLKSGVAVKLVGIGWTPVARATTVVTRMLISSAAGTLRAHSSIVSTRPNQKTKWATVVGNTNRTGTGFSAEVPPVLTMIPASMKPMNRMNRPIPTPIARLSESGTARITASRRPTRTRIVTRMPSRTMTPIAPAGVSPLVRTSPKATAPLMPRPAARAIGAFAKTPMAMVTTPATSAVAAAAAGTGIPAFERINGFTNRM